jgi:hypothetical protein
MDQPFVQESWHTVEDAARAILRHSFAILQADSSPPADGGTSIVPWHVIESARQSALAYFKSCTGTGTDAVHQCTVQSPLSRPQVIHRGNLMGFNEPSAAKYLFRAFCHHPRQPWPDTHPQLERDSCNASHVLHDLLIKILHEISKTQDSEKTSSSQSQEWVTSRTSSHSTSQRYGFAPTTSPIPEVEKRHCPMDYFYYHNMNTRAVNCSEHVDRGLLIAVCLSSVPGLELRVGSGEGNEFGWYCPEEGRQSQMSDQLHRAPGRIAVLAGAALKRYCHDIPACVHRVRCPLLGPRLSISYELRDEGSE